MIRDPRLFFGRAAELTAIWGYLRKDANVSIVAERRLGKSSLLWYVKEMASTEGGVDWPVHYLDLELVAAEADFLSRLGEMLNLAERGQEATTRNIERALEAGRLVLCLDEFDRTASNPAFPPDFFAILRGLSGSPALTLVVATKTPLIDFSATGGMTSPFYNIFPPTPLTLGPLTDDEARELLARTAARADIRFDASTLDAAIALSGGLPWRLQLIGSYLVEAGSNWKEAESRFRDTLAETEGKNGKQWPARTVPPASDRSAWLVALVGGLGTLAAIVALIGSLADSGGLLNAAVALMMVALAIAVVFLVVTLARFRRA